MKLERLSNNTILILFIIMLFAPHIVFFTVKDKLPADNSENRKLATFPDLKLENIGKFPSQFDAYWNDNLPFRAVMQSIYANANCCLFNISPTTKVVVGKKDNENRQWLFYSDENDQNPLKDISGIKSFSDEDLKKIKENILTNTQKLKEQGIDIFFVTAPNKSTIKTQYLPDSIQVAEKTRTDKLYDYLKSANVTNYIFLKDAIVRADAEENTYYSLDTHWNKRGAFAGFKATHNMIYGNTDLLDNTKIDKVTKGEGGDLYKFLGLSLKMKADVDYKITINNNADIVTKNENNVTIYKNNNPIINKDIMIVGDSYATALIENYAQVYRNTYRAVADYYNNALISKYKPDIIVYQRVERYSDQLKNVKIY